METKAAPTEPSILEIDIDSKSESNMNQLEKEEFLEKSLQIRSETPLSDASTSGICSLASSDFESSEENTDEKETNGQEKFIPRSPVIIYEKRNILDMLENIYPYSVFQTTKVPKMTMGNYWERRSVYHRLGPYGKLDEIDFQKCFACDFYIATPKRI